MKISVRVTPGAKIEKVEQKDAGSFDVWVKEPPVAGRANEALLELLAKHFSVPRTAVRILSGRGSRKKVIEIFGIYI